MTGLTGSGALVGGFKSISKSSFCFSISSASGANTWPSPVALTDLEVVISFNSWATAWLGSNSARNIFNSELSISSGLFFNDFITGCKSFCALYPTAPPTPIVAIACNNAGRPRTGATISYPCQ